MIISLLLKIKILVSMDVRFHEMYIYYSHKMLDEKTNQYMNKESQVNFINFKNIKF